MQLEFFYAGPRSKTEDEQLVDWLNQMKSFVDSRPGMRESLASLVDVFQAQPMEMDDYSDPCIPMVIVCGYRCQPEFPFVRPLDEAIWKGFPVKYHCELDKAPSSV